MPSFHGWSTEIFSLTVPLTGDKAGAGGTKYKTPGSFQHYNYVSLKWRLNNLKKNAFKMIGCKGYICTEEMWIGCKGYICTEEMWIGCKGYICTEEMWIGCKGCTEEMWIGGRLLNCPKIKLMGFCSK